MKKILITGSTDGIGKQTAEELLLLGHKIILHGRSDEKCLKTVNELKEKTGSNNISYYLCDFNSLKAVHNFASEVKNDHDFLDVLINNAGVYMNQLEMSKDNYEKTFAINHLAPFLLTAELLPLLKNSDDARIINVSSIAHSKGDIDFENLNGEMYYDSYESYAQSKLANVLFTYSFSERLKGTGITANCLHPGVIDTKLLRTGFAIQGADLRTGAATSVYLTVSDKVKGITGKYFDNLMAIPSSSTSYEKNVQEKLWNISEKMISNALS